MQVFEASAPMRVLSASCGFGPGSGNYCASCFPDDRVPGMAHRPLTAEPREGGVRQCIGKRKPCRVAALRRWLCCATRSGSAVARGLTGRGATGGQATAIRENDQERGGARTGARSHWDVLGYAGPASADEKTTWSSPVGSRRSAAARTTGIDMPILQK